MKTHALYKDWMLVTANYTSDDKLRTTVFNNLIERYNESGRHYHNLIHIETLMNDLSEYFNNTIPVEAYFAIWFHDAIYNILLNNNESRSAALAVEKLNLLQVPKSSIDKVEALIIKTATHADGENDDELTKAFLDADMKILGIEEGAYLNYTKLVRKEFSMFPDILFNAGRKKFIQNTLGSARIYKTQKFYDLYEAKARKNLITELNQLL